MATRKSDNNNVDHTMSVQEAGRRGGHRVQELVQKGEEMENREGTNFGEKLPESNRTKTSRTRDGYDQAA
jgi:hypothetical protein